MLVACFIAGFYTCYSVFTTPYTPNATIIHVGYSPYLGSLDSYTNSIYDFHKELSSKKNRTDSATWCNIYNKFSSSEQSLIIKNISEDSIRFKLLLYPHNGFSNFYTNTFLITKDTLYKASFIPVSIVIDTFMEKTIYRNGKSIIETYDFRPSPSPY